MQTTTTAYNTAIANPVRVLCAQVKVYTGSTLNATYTKNDAIKGIEIQRVGDAAKFFGFAVSHRLNVKLMDVTRAISISTANSLVVSLGVQLPNSSNVEYMQFPKFYVTEVNRDENTNELSITAYDILDKLKNHTVSEMQITAPYTLAQFATAAAAVIGTTCSIPSDSVWQTSYPTGANFEGTETLREACNMLAEATQTIFYSNIQGVIQFKRLGGNTALVITKEGYYTLSSGQNRRLQTICSVTELGDNVSESTTLTGSTQYIRNNAFWELRDDIADLIHNAILAVGDFSINVFECKWRGNPALEIGDKISLTTKNNATVYGYVLNDVITYDGGLNEQTQWDFSEDEAETDTNPTTLGDALKQTFAKVDKANKEITMVANDADTRFTEMQLTTDNIIASVEQVQNNITDNLGGINENIETLTNRVQQTITANEVELMFAQERASGAESVKTNTGFTFDESGLKITKSTSEMSTQITEDGMVVSKNDEAMLVANNQGVEAVNLNASTYLIIGGMARFEKYSDDRIGCFWIG